MKTYKGYQKFFILSAPRSGTTYLTTLLRSHSEIVCEHELFIPQNPLGYNGTVFERYYHRLYQNILPDMWTKHYLFERHFPPIIQAVGFKLLYHHMQQGLQRRLWEYLENTNSIKIVHITRKNLLRQCISLCNARKTGMTSLTKEQRKEYVQMPMRFDPQEMERYFQSVRDCESHYRMLFKHNPVLELTYEELSEHRNKTIQSVLRFLSVDSTRLHSECIKMNTRPLSAAVSNYSELKRYFRDTEWNSFFTE